MLAKILVTNNINDDQIKNKQTKKPQKTNKRRIKIENIEYKKIITKM